LPDRCKGGYFVAPTVVTGLSPSCRVNQEEVFGPFASIIPFRGEAQAVEIANGTNYGLSASVWTNDLGRAHRVAEQLECGTVWVNCWLVRDLRVPFGGAKQSSIGREGGDYALRFFTDPKTVCVKYADEVPS
jgi:aminomuconate-semialdehyde/2-hydroxymuconate-6-semialdehyde dehydrogenase